MSSAIKTPAFQAKASNILNEDNSSIYSGGEWSFKNASAVTGFHVASDGKVGIGTTSPWSQLSVNTAGGATTGYISIKDAVHGGDIRFGKASGVNNTGILGTWTNNDFLFYTNGSERMRIDANGNLLVGKTSSSDSTLGFQTSSAGRVAAGINADNTYLVYNTSVGAYRFYVTAAGQINATSTSITGISDVSLKENIRDLETGLSEILALKPRRFDWKEETKIEQKNVAGFIAQEVEQVLPELIYEYNYSETEIKKSLKMGDMLPTLVKAIQEQQAQIEALKTEVAALKVQP